MCVRSWLNLNRSWKVPIHLLAGFCLSCFWLCYLNSSNVTLEYVVVICWEKYIVISSLWCITDNAILEQFLTVLPKNNVWQCYHRTISDSSASKPFLAVLSQNNFWQFYPRTISDSSIWQQYFTVYRRTIFYLRTISKTSTLQQFVTVISRTIFDISTISQFLTVLP